jgi:hypothetical protein
MVGPSLLAVSMALRAGAALRPIEAALAGGRCVTELPNEYTVLSSPLSRGRITLQSLVKT